jgi:phosphohistidine phosphatase
MNQKEQFVILFRHGIAEDKGSEDDFERRLTGAGAKKVKRVARALARIFPDAGMIYSSPLVRAVQTAERVAKAYGSGLKINETDALRPEADVAQFREMLAQAGGENIICVGHEPNLSHIMLEVTGMSPAGRVSLKKGGFYGVRFSAGGDAQLEWMIAPRIVVDDDSD